MAAVIITICVMPALVAAIHVPKDVQ